MKHAIVTATAMVALAVGLSMAARAADTQLVIESWRTDDLSIWQDKIIPAFEKSHPGIKVTFSRPIRRITTPPLAPSSTRGTAGDLITCRPFDESLGLFKKGQLADLTKLPGMEHFTTVAKVAWTTDDGKSDLLRSDVVGHPRLHLQQGRLQEARHHRFPRPSPNSSPTSRRSRRMAPTCRSRWAPRTSGKPRRWAGKISARTIGTAKKGRLAHHRRQGEADRQALCRAVRAA